MPYDYATFADEVAHERAHQANRFANGDEKQLDALDDEKNGPIQFAAYVTKYSMNWYDGSFAPFGGNALLAFRSSMIKVAALAFSAVCWVERRMAQAETSKY